MSLWEKEIKNGNKLNNDVEVDILIIGAGMTGLNTAYYLKDKNIAVVDSFKIGHGVTLNTTAKINYFQGISYTKMSNDKAKLYLKSQLEAIKNIKEIIERENIDCNLERNCSYVFANDENERIKLKREVLFLKKNGIKVREDKLKEFPNKLSYYVEDTYTFHPLKYLEGIVKILKENKISIYEDTTITKREEKDNFYICHTDNYKIKCSKVVLALHYPYFIKPLFIPLKASIEKSYILVNKIDNNYNYNYISAGNQVYSSRFYSDLNDYKIYLGESHNSAFKQNDLNHFDKVLKQFNLNEKEVIDFYSNVDLITFDYLPFIGKVKDNMYVSTGYNTWGMTNSVIGSKIISDLILNKENGYIDLFNPKRVNLTLFLKMPYYIFSQIKSFVGPKIIKNKNWYKNVYFEKRNGINVGIYVDEKGKHIVKNKCPHLGCSLIFNEVEKSWDCPCHSSRFDIDGNCIKGPSFYDIKYNDDIK